MDKWLRKMPAFQHALIAGVYSAVIGLVILFLVKWFGLVSHPPSYWVVLGIVIGCTAGSLIRRLKDNQN